MLKLTIVLVVALLSATAFAEDESMFNVSYVDAADKGANSKTPFVTSEGKETTVGQYRQELVDLAALAVSLQFNHVVPHEIDVNFKAPEGYGAITYGPSFTEFTEFNRADKFGFLEVGRTYPATLVSALKSIRTAQDEDATVSFADNVEHLRVESGYDYAPIVYTMYHELMHVLGFATTDCLGKCIPEPVSKNSHVSPYIYYNSDRGLKPFESLSINQKTDAYLSIDKLWFGGSEASKNAAMAELTSGHVNGFVYMYATPNSDTGSVDGQSGDHFSFDVQPEQLMYSSRARTTDLGMAAYLLCDVGWCQDGGRVIEQSVSAVFDENASSDTESVIEVSVRENINVSVNEFELVITPDAAMNVLEFQDPNGMCSERNNGYYCTGSLGALGKMNVRLIVSPLEEYVLKGHLRSTAFDVDRDGFNNILDVTLAKTPEPKPIAPITEVKTEPKGSESGGSMSFLIFSLLLLCQLRGRSSHSNILSKSDD